MPTASRFGIGGALLYLLCFLAALRIETSLAGPAPIQGPLRASRNPNYFMDASGSPLILCGSQTWNTLQDWGTSRSVQPLDFNAFIGFLKAHGHNFTFRKTIDTLNDLPNVLWIVSEEAPMKSTWWNSHLISLVRTCERGKHSQHPIGYATLESPSDSILYNSDADWVAPWAWVSPTTSCGTGNPPCKVNINDSDHSYFGMWNDTPQKNRNYAWENFTTGNQVLFMDPYLVYYPRENRNLCLSPVHGIGSSPDPRWDNFRNNLGYLLQYSRKLNLACVTPRDSLCSTKYCLAQTPSSGAEYLAYAPAGGAFTMDLSAMPDSRRLAVERFNPATGETITESPIAAGSSSQPFRPPFSGDAVLYLVDTEGHR